MVKICSTVLDPCHHVIQLIESPKQAMRVDIMRTVVDRTKHAGKIAKSHNFPSKLVGVVLFEPLIVGSDSIEIISHKIARQVLGVETAIDIQKIGIGAELSKTEQSVDVN